MADNNEDIIKRLEYLEEEMKLLRSQQAELLTKKTFIDEPKKTVKNKMAHNAPARTMPTNKVEDMQRPPTPVQPRKEFDLEKALGLWLPRVFMFILLLGVLWGLKVGVDNGYITNPVRTAMGYMGTALLYYLGMKYYNKNNTVFGLTLLGGFIALGILTTFAAHHLYGYFNFTVAFIIGIAYIVAGILLSEKTKSETLTIFSAIGGFLLPFLLEGESGTSLQFCAYILILFLSLFYVSLKQRHKYTFYITFLLFHLTLLAYGVLSGTDGDEQILVGTVLIQHLSLLLFYLKGKFSRHVFSEALIYTNFVFTLGWIKILGDTQEIVAYGFLALIYVAKAVYFFSRKDELLGGVLSAVSVFALSAFVLSFSFENDNVPLLLLLVNGTVGLWVGLRFNTLRTIVTSSFIYVIAAYTVFSMIDINRFFSLDHAVWIVFLSSIVFIYYSIYKLSPPFLIGKMESVNQSLIVGQVISLIYIGQLTGLALSGFYLSYNTFIHIYLLVFMAALSVMYFLYKWNRGKYLTHAAVTEFLLLGLVMMLVGLSDFQQKGSYLFNLSVEVLYVIMLSTLFVAILKDRFYIQSEKLKAMLSNLAIILQVVYFIFLNKWYLSLTSVYAWDREYVFLVHTFLLFAFSFVSISIGRKKNWKHVKIIGAALIVVCVLKLFIVDLGSISILVRAVLFTIVGIVGLIYSRIFLRE